MKPIYFNYLVARCKKKNVLKKGKKKRKEQLYKMSYNSCENARVINLNSGKLWKRFTKSRCHIIGLKLTYRNKHR